MGEMFECRELTEDLLPHAGDCGVVDSGISHTCVRDRVELISCEWLLDLSDSKKIHRGSEGKLVILSEVSSVLRKRNNQLHFHGDKKKSIIHCILTLSYTDRIGVQTYLQPNHNARSSASFTRSLHHYLQNPHTPSASPSHLQQPSSLPPPSHHRLPPSSPRHPHSHPLHHDPMSY